MTKQNHKKPTKEEIREGTRKLALNNLGIENLMDIYTSRIAQQKIYGKKGAEIMHDFVYNPVLDKDIEYTDIETGKKVLLYKGTDSVGDALRNSRKQGEAFSGGISEKKIVDEVVRIIENSLQYLKVEDILEYLGKDAKELKKQYQGKYIVDLMPQMPSEEEAKKMTLEEHEKLEEQNQFYQSLIGAYISKALNSRMKTAFEDSEKREWKGLESILMEPQKSGGKMK